MNSASIGEFEANGLGVKAAPDVLAIVAGLGQATGCSDDGLTSAAKDEDLADSLVLRLVEKNPISLCSLCITWCIALQLFCARGSDGNRACEVSGACCRWDSSKTSMV